LTVSYELLEAGQSELLCAAIRRVYGDTYPAPEFYDPDYLRAAIATGLLYSVVAREADGEVVGCMSTALEIPGDVTADGSALMIAEDHRGQGIVGRLGHHSLEVYQRLGLSGLHLYALALHDRVQNQSGKAGAVVTGVLPAWFSERAKVAGYGYPDARIGAVCLYMPLAPLPARSCYLPHPYAGELRRIYGELGADRRLIASPDPVTEPAVTTLEIEDKPANSQRRVLVHRCGVDFAGALEATLRNTPRAVTYLDLPLWDAAVGRATACAREQGFRFGALMVDRRGGDRLRLQSYDSGIAAPGAMVLASDSARRLLDFVLADGD